MCDIFKYLFYQGILSDKVKNLEKLSLKRDQLFVRNKYTVFTM